MQLSDIPEYNRKNVEDLEELTDYINRRDHGKSAENNVLPYQTGDIGKNSSISSNTMKRHNS